MMRCEIRIWGKLNTGWLDSFEYFEMTQEGNITVLSGVLEDQSRLRGVLNHILDLNLKLLKLSIEDLEFLSSSGGEDYEKAD